jgi:hypothetical protein
MKRLWLLQALGNAFFFWCAFTWLGLRDSRTSQLIETGVLGLVILISWLWLQDGTFAYCADRSEGLWDAFRRAAKNLAVFSAVVIVFVLLVWALGKLTGPLTEAGQRTASWLTFHLRKPIKPPTWVAIYLAVLWGIRGIVLPAVFLPMAAGAARHGIRGVWTPARRIFWLQYLIAVAIGFYLPAHLAHWVPRFSETTAQVLSFTARFGLAYILMISSWLALAFFVSHSATVKPPATGSPST